VEGDEHFTLDDTGFDNEQEMLDSLTDDKCMLWQPHWTGADESMKRVWEVP
jgi:hypothetical protein